MESHPATWSLAQLDTFCRLRFVRRSGPGGQHRNKVSTAVVVEFPGTEIRAEAGERRSQRENRDVALSRLRRKLAVEIRQTIDVHNYAPSSRWRSRLRSGKIVVSPSHFDFAALLAEALDVLAAAQWDQRVAAERLHCSATQLLRFLSREPAALAHVNQQRKQLGQPALRPRL